MSDDDDPYDLGFNAYRQRQSRDDNPYSDYTDDYMSWDDGWLDAMDREKARNRERHNMESGDGERA